MLRLFANRVANAILFCPHKEDVVALAVAAADDDDHPAIIACPVSLPSSLSLSLSLFRSPCKARQNHTAYRLITPGSFGSNLDLRLTGWLAGWWGGRRV